MIPVSAGVRMWLSVGRTDMRRGMNGLALQVQETLGRDPFAGETCVGTIRLAVRGGDTGHSSLQLRLDCLPTVDRLIELLRRCDTWAPTTRLSTARVTSHSSKPTPSQGKFHSACRARPCSRTLTRT